MIIQVVAWEMVKSSEQGTTSTVSKNTQVYLV